MKIEIDTFLETITVDGVDISLALLKTLANPDKKTIYRIHRADDVVTITDVGHLADIT